MDIGLLLLRLAVGSTIAANGARMLFGWFGGQGLEKTGQLFVDLGFQPGHRYALMAALAEIGGGVLLASGFVTPLSAAIIFAVMIVAAFSAHIKQGFWITKGGFEYTFVLSVAALTLAFTGPGSLSLDAILGRSWGGGLWGLGAIVAGILASLVRLAQRHKRLPTSNDLPKDRPPIGQLNQPARMVGFQCQPHSVSVPDAFGNTVANGKGIGHKARDQAR